MMYGYGEDALTLYAMTKGLRAFLDQLNDRHGLLSAELRKTIPKSEC